MWKKIKHHTTIIAGIFIIFSCSIGPVPINYGSDVCSQCRMTITDSRYGTELISKKGKIYKFDSIECLIHFLNDELVSKENIHSVLITDFISPGVLTDAKPAFYIISSNLPSPMGENLSGFKNKEDAEKMQKEKGGKLYSWIEIINVLKK